MASWWDSVKDLIVQYQPQAPAAPQGPAVSQQTRDVQPPPGAPPAPVAPPQGPLPANQKIAAIHQAGRSLVMLKMTYNGVERLVEPYSFRNKSTGTLFFGYCHKDQGIEAFKPDKIEQIEVTDIPFVPRWPVEVGRG